MPPASEGPIVAPEQYLGRLIEEPNVEVAVSRRELGDGRDAIRQLIRDLKEALAIVAPLVSNGAQDLAKGRHVEPAGGGVIGAAVERPAFRSQEDRHRPASLAGHGHHRLHIKTIDIGPLLTVDLDAHKMFVHERRGLRVFERLMRHDVAPMAGGVSDAQEDGFIQFLGHGKRLRAPGIPFHRILGVLKQVRGGGVREFI